VLTLVYDLFIMKIIRCLFAGVAAGFVFFTCSEAPLIEREANRVVLVELFSTPLDE
jgi:hypothetical protein